MSMSPSHTELGVSRKRRHRHGPKAKACDSCWKRKIKCDKAVPKCAWCRHYCVTCTFNRRHSDRPPTEAAEYSEACNVAPRSNIVHTATQLGNQAALSGQSSPQVNAPLENLPKMTNGTPEKLSLEWFFNPSQRARSRAPVLQSGKIYLDGEELGTIDCENGIPLFSSQGQAWVENRSGESIIYNEIRESPESCYTSSTNTSTSDRAPPLTLPPISLVESSLESFLRSRTRANFPLIDPNLFRETIQAAYGSSEIGPFRLISARICIATFLSFEAIFNLDIERAPPFNFEEYISAAENALPQLTAGMHLDGFQACVMLVSLWQYSRWGKDPVF
ncbi:fungal specific transcription factor [Penicillium odoratum]|uniref:fungal specific transcription factor n=1 Tax=Penicillium odoratum TaxID=1167516 RepID=UPI0025496D3D|nr:fungal specific transcription factor [Penicillium odoratum]KAJ5764733.1 fungal specific transcription factor [Penicillium odoratum]